MCAGMAVSDGASTQGATNAGARPVSGASVLLASGRACLIKRIVRWQQSAARWWYIGRGYIARSC